MSVSHSSLKFKVGGIFTFKKRGLYMYNHLNYRTIFKTIFFHNSKTKSVLSDISKHFFCFYVRIFVSNIKKKILCNYIKDLHEHCSGY